MRLFFKQNLLHVLLSIIFLSVFIVLTYFSSKFSATTDSLTKNFENLKNDLNYKNQELSYFNHVESDTSRAVHDLEYLASVEKEVSLFLKYIFNETENVSDEWASKSAESVNASLTRLLPRLRKKCLGSNVIFLATKIDGEWTNNIFNEFIYDIFIELVFNQIVVNES